MLLHVAEHCTPPALPTQTTPEPANTLVQMASGLHVDCCSTSPQPTSCRRKLEEWSDGDSRELHLEVSPGEERTLEALVRFCYTKQIPFNRGGLLHREAQGDCCTGRWAKQGGELHREATAQDEGQHREVGCTGGCCKMRRAAQGGGLHRKAAAQKEGQHREVGCTERLLHRKKGSTGSYWGCSRGQSSAGPSSGQLAGCMLAKATAPRSEIGSGCAK